MTKTEIAVSIIRKKAKEAGIKLHSSNKVSCTDNTYFICCENPSEREDLINFAKQYGKVNSLGFSFGFYFS